MRDIGELGLEADGAALLQINGEEFVQEKTMEKMQRAVASSVGGG